jgi:TusA-related sulfurtransferase
MKRSILISIAVIALAAGAAFAHCGNCPGDKKAEPSKAAEAKPAKKDCGDCPMHKKHAAKGTVKKCGGVTCPENIEGAQTVTKKIENGLEVTTTAKNKEVVAKIQELAVVHYAPKADKCKGCPTTVSGAETKLENIADGIKVTITGKAPGIVKQIQEAAAKEQSGHGKPEAKKQAKAGKKYMCAMKCVEAAAPGKCPKCGMPLEEVK